MREETEKKKRGEPKRFFFKFHERRGIIGRRPKDESIAITSRVGQIGPDASLIATIWSVVFRLFPLPPSNSGHCTRWPMRFSVEPHTDRARRQFELNRFGHGKATVRKLSHIHNGACSSCNQVDGRENPLFKYP